MLLLASIDLPSGNLPAVIHDERMFVTVPTPTGTRWAEIPRAEWDRSPIAQAVLAAAQPVAPL